MPCIMFPDFDSLCYQNYVWYKFLWRKSFGESGINDIEHDQLRQNILQAISEYFKELLCSSQHIS